MRLSRTVSIPDEEIQLVPIRAGGPGGQKVNKVSTAIQLFFNINSSSLPEKYRERLLSLADNRISSGGVLIIKAQSHRTLERNRMEALSRLKLLIRSVMSEPKRRRPTRPKASARQKRLDDKKRTSLNKILRRKINP